MNRRRPWSAGATRCKGKPIDLDACFALPEDLRVAYTLLKNANCVPEDVAVMNGARRAERRKQAGPRYNCSSASGSTAFNRRSASADRSIIVAA